MDNIRQRFPDVLLKTVKVLDCTSWPEDDIRSDGASSSCEVWGNILSISFILNISVSVGHQGSVSTTADTVQNVNTLSLHNIDLSYNSPQVSHESVECSGQVGRSRSPSPLWSNDDSVHDVDFDIDAEVELEAQRRRWYGPLSDSEDGEVPPSPPGRSRYRDIANCRRWSPEYRSKLQLGGHGMPVCRGIMRHRGGEQSCVQCWIVRSRTPLCGVTSGNVTPTCQRLRWRSTWHLYVWRGSCLLYVGNKSASLHRTTPHLRLSTTLGHLC